MELTEKTVSKNYVYRGKIITVRAAAGRQALQAGADRASRRRVRAVRGGRKNTAR